MANARIFPESILSVDSHLSRNLPMPVSLGLNTVPTRSPEDPLIASLRSILLANQPSWARGGRVLRWV